MVTICLQCGDKGFANALVYCVNCLDLAVHRYCLDKLPETLDEFIPWFCEACKPKTVKQSPLRDSVSQQLSEAPRKLESTELAIDSPLKVKSKTEKKDNTLLPPMSNIELDLYEWALLEEDLLTPRSVAETMEQRHRSSSDQRPRGEFDSTLCAELTADSSPLKIESMTKREDATTSVTKAEKLKHPNSPSLRVEERRKIGEEVESVRVNASQTALCDTSDILGHRNREEFDLALCAELAADSSPLKIESMMKREDVTMSATKAEKLKHPTSPSLRVEERRKIGEEVESVRVNASQTALCDTSDILGHRNREEFDLTLCAELAADSSPLKIESMTKREDVTTSVTKAEKLKHPNSPSLRVEERRKIGEEVESNTSQTALCDTSDISGHRNHLCAQLVIDPIWRGSFRVHNKNDWMVDGIVAQLSNKACPQVCEEASLLPAWVCAEMLPKSDVWPKSFERVELNDGHIALYFFPESKRCEVGFECLVNEMVCQELAMRTMVKNAELLVFPSTELPLLYWKFWGKYYLWGVFRGKQATSSDLTDHQLNIPNGKNECFVHSKSRNDMDYVDKRKITKANTWDTRSPLSPLSEDGSMSLALGNLLSDTLWLCLVH